MTQDVAARKAQTRAQFNTLAPDYDMLGPRTFAHFGERLVEFAGVAAGQRVLDVAAGRGAVLFPAAERVGATGAAVGIDLSDGMVAALNGEAERRGLAARATVMDAETLDFPDASFDCVLCGFGVMFFPDLARGLAEFHRVLRPGGRLGVSTWRVAQAGELVQLLRELDMGNAVPPGWISDPEVLARAITAAGFRDVRVTEESQSFVYADLDEYWRASRTTGARGALDALDAAQTERLRAALAERLARFRRDDGLHVPANALLAVAGR